MKVCDIAQAFHASSGGIKTYLSAKRAYLSRHPGHSHALIVPGARATLAREAAGASYTVASPVMPGCAPYRLLLRADQIAALLAHEQPDVVEVDGPYVGAWVALRHRRRNGAAVVAFHH